MRIFFFQGSVEVVTRIDEMFMERSFPPPSSAFVKHEDHFGETALFERLKSPNQCSNYRPESPSSVKSVSLSLEVLQPFSVCVSGLNQLPAWSSCN